MWRDLLGTGAVTADSNFFDLGGESLLFLRMVARLRRVFGVPVDAEDASHRPTPGALAALVESLVAAVGRA